MPAAGQTGPAAPADEIPQRMDRERSADSNAKSEWQRHYEEKNFDDSGVALPPPPKGELIEFFVSGATRFRFFIDPASLTVGDGVVRYTLVARSPSGAENVSYEGIRCASGTYRIYAFADRGTWSRNTNSAWKEIEPRSVQRWHNQLRGRYFCPNRLPIQTAAEGLDALRRGGHPSAENVGAGY